MARKSKLFNIFYVLVLLSFSSTAVLAIDAKSIYQKSKNSIVLIKVLNNEGKIVSLGSGFFVKKNKVATNLHVLEGAFQVTIRLSTGKEYNVEYISGIDFEHDLVLLNSSIINAPLSLSEREPIIGEDIVAIGNPRGLESTISKGVVSGIRSTGNSTFYQITSPISPGSSGGVVIDNSGKVLGVPTFYLENGQNLNFAVPSKYIQKMLFNPINMPVSSLPSQTNKKKSPENNKIKGKNFRIHNFGPKELIWFMSKNDAQKIIEKVKSEHDHLGCKNKLGFNENEDILFIVYGSLDTPNSGLVKNTYVLNFSSDSLISIKWYSELQEWLTEKTIDSYLGGRKYALKMIYDNIVDDFKLQYGQPIWEKLDQKAWSTETKIVKIDFQFDDISVSGPFAKQEVIVTYTPKE